MILSLTIASFLTLAPVGEPVQQTSATAVRADKGRRMLTDTNLFPDSDSSLGLFLEIAESLKPPFTTGLFGNRVATSEAPALTALQAKYGKPDRTEKRKKSDDPGGLPFEATVYWYGEFGFCVPGLSYPNSAAAGKVIYVLWDKKK